MDTLMIVCLVLNAMWLVEAIIIGDRTWMAIFTLGIAGALIALLPSIAALV